jgi:hypothetical protein
VRARTPLVLYTLERCHFVPAVAGYASSSREVDAIIVDRLGRFSPGPGGEHGPG